MADEENKKSISFQVPKISEDNIKNAIEETFGIKVDLKRQSSYDDLTYHVTVIKNLGTNGNLGSIWPHGYIFKVTNPGDSENHDLIDGQVCFLLHVRKAGINAPDPVPNKNGTYWTHAKFHYIDDQNNTKEISLIVRMFKFLPGHLLHYRPKSMDAALFYDLGKLAAKIHLASKTFHHKVFESHEHLWSLDFSIRAREFVHIYPDEKRRNLALNALEKFENVVLKNAAEWERGQIHGDLNEHNLLVEESPDRPSGYRLTAVIDLWDTQYSCLIYDLALAIVYMMLENHSVPIWDVGGHILAGYCSLKPIPSKEVAILQTCMAARIAQSVVIGYHTYQQAPAPENEYVLFTQKKGWPVLEEMLGKTDDEVMDRWNIVMESYKI